LKGTIFSFVSGFMYNIITIFFFIIMEKRNKNLFRILKCFLIAVSWKSQ